MNDELGKSPFILFYSSNPIHTDSLVAILSLGKFGVRKYNLPHESLSINLGGNQVKQYSEDVSKFLSGIL